MAKNKKKAGAEADPTAAQETATRPCETEEKGGQAGGADAEGREDTGMDQGCETPPTGGERLSEDDKAFLKGMVEAAKKVFASNSVQRLWFTADGCGFGNEADAADHAAHLENPTLLMIDRNTLAVGH